MPIVLIKASDSNGSGKRQWKKGYVVDVVADDHIFGDREVYPYFYHIHVSGITLQEARDLVEEWNHKVTIDSLSHDPTTMLRRIEITSKRTSQSGKHNFKSVDVNTWVTAWGGTVIDSGPKSFIFEIVQNPTYTREFDDMIHTFMSDQVYQRARFYVPNVAMNYIENQGGVIFVTYDEIAPYIEDGLST